MRIAPEHRIEVPDGVMMRDLQGEAVILNLDSECYFGLDEVGTRMWTALTMTPNVAGAVQVLLDEFDVDPETLRSDLAEFVESLAAAGLVRIHAG